MLPIGKSHAQLIADECAKDPNFAQVYAEAKRQAQKDNRRYLAIEERGGLRPSRPHRRTKSHRPHA